MSNAEARIAAAMSSIPAEDLPLAMDLFGRVVEKIRAGVPQGDIDQYISREIERHRSEKPCAAPELG